MAGRCIAHVALTLLCLAGSIGLGKLFACMINFVKFVARLYCYFYKAHALYYKALHVCTMYRYV